MSNWPPVAGYFNNGEHVRHHLSHHHEYTAPEMRDVLHRMDLENIEVRFIEDALGRKGVLRSFGDIKTQDRDFRQYWRQRGSGWLNPFEWARMFFYGLVMVFPQLKSVLIARAQKPKS